MQSESLCIKIITNASHLYGKFSIAWTSVSIRGSQKGNWIVSLLNDQHSYDFFITIDYEVSTKFVGIFILLYQLLFIESCQMTAVWSYHNWNLSKWGSECINRAVDLTCYLTKDWCRICLSCHSALLRVNFLLEDCWVIGSEWFTESHVSKA